MITDSLLGCGIGTVGAGDNFKKVGGTQLANNKGEGGGLLRTTLLSDLFVA